MKPEWGISVEGGFFCEERHIYRTTEGQVVPSATQVFDVLGMSNFSGIPEDVLEWKRNYGQAVHRGVELVVYGQLDWDSVDEAIVPAVTGCEQFLKGLGYIPEAVEELRIATVNGMSYGMRIDHRGSILYKGTRRSCIVDLKTGSKFSPTWNWQGGAYVRGSGKASSGAWLCLILQVNKDGKVTPYWVDSLKAGQEFSVLLSAANLKLNSGLAKIKNVEEE